MAVAGTRSASQKTLRFLYELREGPTNESFGIHVAQLAGLPKPVIDRAWKVLEELEANNGASGTSSSAQLHLFNNPKASQEMPFEDLSDSPALVACEPHPILKELELTDVNQLTPVQALNFIVKLKELSVAV